VRAAHQTVGNRLLFGREHRVQVGARSLRGAATRYPVHNHAAARPITLEERINGCREGRMTLTPLAPGSEALNAVSGYVKYLSHGMPVRVGGGGRRRPARAGARRGSIPQEGRPS